MDKLDKINPAEWEKYWQANVSYFMCSLLGQAYTQCIPSWGIKGFKKVYIFSHDGASSCYFNLKDREKYGQYVISKYAKNKKAIKNLSELIIKKADKILAYTSQQKGTLSRRQYLKIKEMFLEYNSYHIMPRHIADFMGDEISQEFVDVLKKARIYVEEFHYEIDKFMSKQILAIVDNNSYSPETVLLATSMEVEKYFKTQKFPSREELLLRKKSAGYVFSKRKITILNSVQSVRMEKKFIVNSLSSEIKGNIAYQGRVTGLARIITDPAHYKKFDKGDILITVMTRPEFVPLMKKAAAIITDAGGLLCHAAIIARELNKPCIIGTKIATQVLHDGDLVEVDANKGVVKISKKAK